VCHLGIVQPQFLGCAVGGCDCCHLECILGCALNGLAVYPVLVFRLGCGLMVLCFQGCVSGDDVISDVMVMSW